MSAAVKIAAGGGCIFKLSAKDNPSFARLYNASIDPDTQKI